MHITTCMKRWIGGFAIFALLLLGQMAISQRSSPPPLNNQEQLRDAVLNNWRDVDELKREMRDMDRSLQDAIKTAAAKDVNFAVYQSRVDDIRDMIRWGLVFVVGQFGASIFFDVRRKQTVERIEKHIRRRRSSDGEEVEENA